MGGRREDAYRRGSLFAISSLSLWWGFTQYRRGELEDAEESLRAALGEFELWGYGEQQAQIYCDAFLAAVLRERGDLDGARHAPHADARRPRRRATGRSSISADGGTVRLTA